MDTTSTPCWFCNDDLSADTHTYGCPVLTDEQRTVDLPRELTATEVEYYLETGEV